MASSRSSVALTDLKGASLRSLMAKGQLRREGKPAKRPRKIVGKGAVWAKPRRSGRRVLFCFKPCAAPRQSTAKIVPTKIRHLSGRRFRCRLGAKNFKRGEINAARRTHQSVQ